MFCNHWSMMDLYKATKLAPQIVHNLLLNLARTDHVPSLLEFSIAKGGESRLSKARDTKVNAKLQLEDIKASITAEQALRKESVERSQVLENHDKLREELVQLTRELESYGDADPVKFEETKRSVILAKEATLRWTDNYSVLLTHFCRERNVDPGDVRRHLGVPEDYEDI
ncbi:Meiotic nuclear division protein 1 [Leucoagaricus gongylophorus]